MQESPVESPLAAASSIEIAEELWRAGGLIRDVLGWAGLVSAWLVGLGVLGFVDVFVVDIFWLVLPYLIIGAVLFGITAPMVFLEARRGRRVYRQWQRLFMPFRYMVQFEMLPVQRASREEDILQRYLALIPALSRPPRAAVAGMIMPRGKPQMGQEVRGKSTSHRFSLFLLTSTDEGWALFLRRFDSDAPVTAAEITRFKDDVEDVARRYRPDGFIAGAFSKAGFAPDAVALVTGDPVFGKANARMDLIQETETGYRIVVALPD